MSASSDKGHPQNKRKINHVQVEQGNHGDDVNKKEIQDGFSWWTNLMMGIPAQSKQIVVKKIQEIKIDKVDETKNEE